MKRKSFLQRVISLLLLVALSFQTSMPLVYADARYDEWKGAWDTVHSGQAPPPGEYNRHVVRDDAKREGKTVSEEEVRREAEKGSGGGQPSGSLPPAAAPAAPSAPTDTSGHYENLQWHIAHGTAEKDASGNWVVTDRSWQEAWKLTGGKNPDFAAYNRDPEVYREQYPDIAVDIDRYYDDNQPGVGKVQNIAVVGTWGTPISQEATSHCQGFTGADRSNCEQIVQHALDSGEPWYRYCGGSGGQCINFDSSHWEAAVKTGLEVNQRQVVEAELAASDQKIDPLYRQAAVDYLLYGQKTADGQYRPATVPEVRKQLASLDTQIKALRVAVDEALFGGSDTETARQYGDVAESVVASWIGRGIAGGEVLSRAVKELKAQVAEAAQAADIGGSSLEGTADTSGPMLQPTNRSFHEIEEVGHLTFDYQGVTYAIGVTKDGKVDIQGPTWTHRLEKASADDFQFWFENGVPEKLLSDFAVADQKYRESLIAQRQNEYAQIWAGFQYFQGKSVKPKDAPSLDLASPPEDKREGLAFRRWLDEQANQASIVEAASYYQKLAEESGVKGLYRPSKDVSNKSFDEAFEELKNEYQEAVAKANEPALSLQSAYLAIAEGMTVQVGEKPEEVLSTRGVGGMMTPTTPLMVAETEVGFGRLVAMAEEIEMDRLRRKMGESTPTEKLAMSGLAGAVPQSPVVYQPQEEKTTEETGFARIFRQKVEKVEIPPAPLKKEIAFGVYLDNPEYYLQPTNEKEARDHNKEAKEVAVKIRQEVKAGIIQKEGETTAIVEPRADSIPEVISSLFVGKEKAVGPTEQRSVHYRLMGDGTLYLTYKGNLYNFPGSPPVVSLAAVAGQPVGEAEGRVQAPSFISTVTGAFGSIGGFLGFGSKETITPEKARFATPEEMVGPRNVNIGITYYDPQSDGLSRAMPIGQEFKISGYTFEGKKIEATCRTTSKGCEADLPPGTYDVGGEFIQYRGGAKITVPLPVRAGEELPDYKLTLNPEAKPEENIVRGAIIFTDESVRQPETPDFGFEVVAERRDGTAFRGSTTVSQLLGGDYEISLPDGEYTLYPRLVNPLAKPGDESRIVAESPRNFRVIDSILRQCDESWKNCQIPQDTSDIFDIELEQKGDQIAIVQLPKAVGLGLVGSVHQVTDTVSSAVKLGTQSVVQVGSQVGDQIGSLAQRVTGGVGGKLFPKEVAPSPVTAGEWRRREEEEKEETEKIAAIIKERGSSTDLTSTQMQAWTTTAFEELAAAYNASLDELKVDRRGLKLKIGQPNVPDANDPSQRVYWEYLRVQEENEAFYGNMGLTGQYTHEVPYARAAQPVIQRFGDQKLLLKAIEAVNEACGKMKDKCGGRPVRSYDNPEVDLTQDQRDLLAVFLMAYSRNEDAKVSDALVNIGVMGGQAVGSAYMVAQSGGTLAPLVLANILMSPAGGFTYSLQDRRTADTFNRLMAAKYGSFVFNSQETSPNVTVLDRRAYEEAFPLPVEAEREHVRFELWTKYSENINEGMPYRRFVDGQITHEQYQRELEALVEREVGGRVTRQIYENDVVFGDRVIHYLPSAEVGKDYRRTVEKMKVVVNPEDNQTFLEVDVEVVDPMVLASYRLLVYDENSSYYGQTPSVKTADGQEHLEWGLGDKENRLATLAFVENLNKFLPEEKKLDLGSPDQLTDVVRVQTAFEEYEKFVLGTPIGEQRAGAERTAATSFLTGMAVDALFSNFVDIGTAVVGRFIKTGSLVAQAKYLFGDEVAQEALEKVSIEEGGTLVVRVAETVMKEGREEVEEKFIPIMVRGIESGTTAREFLDEARRTVQIPLENTTFRYLNPQASRLVDAEVKETAWRVLPVGGDWLPNIFKRLPEGPEELLARVPVEGAERLEKATGKGVAGVLAALKKETEMLAEKAGRKAAQGGIREAAEVLDGGEVVVLPQADEGVGAVVRATAEEVGEAAPPASPRWIEGLKRLVVGEPKGITAPRPPKPEIEIRPFSEVPRIEVDPASLTRPVVSESAEGIGSGKVVYRVTMEIGGEEKAIAVHTYSGGATMDFGGVINGAQVLDEAGVGARFLGIADLGDGRQAFLTEIIEGDVPEAVPKWISDQTIEDVKQGLRLLREKGFDFRDPQYMVTPGGRAVFMDPDTVVKFDYGVKLPSLTPVLTDAKIQEEIAYLQALRGGVQSESLVSRIVNLPRQWAGRNESVVLEDLIPAEREAFVRYIDPQGRGRLDNFVDRAMTSVLNNYNPHVGVVDIGGTIQILDGDVMQTYRIVDAAGRLNFISEVQIGEKGIRSQVGNFFQGIGESLGLVGQREAEVAEEAVKTVEVVSRAKFISNPDSIPQGGKKIRLDPEAVRRYGLAPTAETSIDEVNFYLSKPFRMDPGDGERLAAIVYVETSEGVHARPVVQSVSQGVWRAVSHTDGYGFFGKGLGENGLVLPFEVENALNKLSGEEFLEISNPEALGVFYGLLEKSSKEHIPNESPFLAQTAIRGLDSLAGENVRFIDDRGAIFESKVVDGEKLYRLFSLPEGSADIQSFYSPELSQSFLDEWTILFRTHNDASESKLFIEPSSFQFRSGKAPGKFIGAMGELDVCPRGLCKGKGYVFLSEDETIRYLFGQDETTGKLFLMAGEPINMPINTYGIRTWGFDLRELAMPLYEYKGQLPTKYIGNALPGGGYFDASAYIDEFPFIQEARRVIDNLPSEVPKLKMEMIRITEETAPASADIFDRAGNFFRGIGESLGFAGPRSALPLIDEEAIEPLRRITTVNPQLANREGQILASLHASLPEDVWQRVNQIHITPERSRSMFISSGKDEKGLVYDLYVVATGSFDQSALKRSVAGAVTDYRYTFSGLGETRGLIEVASQRAERSVGGFYADAMAAIVTGNEEELGRLASQGGLSLADIQILRKHTTDVFSGINLDYIQPVSPFQRGINFLQSLPALIRDVLRLSFGGGGSVLAAEAGLEADPPRVKLPKVSSSQTIVLSPAFYQVLKRRLALFEAFADKDVEKMTEEEVLAALEEVAEKDLKVRPKIEEREGRIIMTTGLEGQVSTLLEKGLYRIRVGEIEGIETWAPSAIELTALEKGAILKVGLSPRKKKRSRELWQSLFRPARAQSLDFESLVAWGSPGAEQPEKIPPDKTWFQVELYRDENENGYYDPGEPPVPWAGVQVEFEPLSRQEKYHLLAGWNLVAFPFQPGSVKTASQLVRDIAKQGGHVTIVAYYENGRWQEYVQRGDKYYGRNFQIEPGKAYFLLNHQETDWQVAGLPLKKPLNLKLKAGWNGIGLPDSALTAKELIGKINEIGCPLDECVFTPKHENADVAARWYSGLWDVLMQKIILKEEIDTYGVDTYGTDFAIESTRGYLLRLRSPVEW